MLNNLPWPLVPFETLFSEPVRNGIYKQKEFHGRGCKIVNMGELFAHPRLRSNIEMSRVELTEKEKEKSLLKSGDLIFARRSLTAAGAGKCSIVLDADEETTFESSIIRVRLNKENALPGFYYYLFNSPIGKWLLGTILRQTAVSGITGGDLAKLLVPQPPLNVQQQLVENGRSLDDKITLNRQINQTLEQMAQALFKSWFVDFDPVVDNALDAGFFEQGLQFSDELLHRAEARKAVRESADFKPLPEDIRQLFPVAFEECSEPSLSLGRWVPKGWKPSNVGFEFDVTMGQSPPGSTYNEIGSGLPFFQGKTDFGFRFPSNRIYCTEPKRMAKKDDTLISVRAPVGDINLAAEDCAIGRGLAAARHKSGSISFSYYVMNSLSKYFEVFEGEGTVFGSINQKDFKALPLIKYPGEIITKFDEFCGNWDKRINNLSVEISTLTDLRDTLLPKLISGELRLSDSEVDTADEVLA